MDGMCGFWSVGGGGRLGGEWVFWYPACGACVCLAGRKEKEGVNRVRGRQEAERRETRGGRRANSVQGGGKGESLPFWQRMEKGGLRTAIGVRSVRVWGKRGADRPQTRLRGIFRSPLLFI